MAVTGVIMPAKPTIVELSMDRLQEALQRAEATLDAEDYETFKAVVESYAYLADLIESKSTTIGRLRKLLFGAKTEKTDAVLDGKASESSNSPAPHEDAKDESSEEKTSRQERPPPPGHGRNGASAYHGAKTVDIPHPTLQPGDPCPDCGRGTVYDMRRPGVLIRLIAQAPVQATVYRLQKLRCHLCGKVFTAPAPEGAGPEKFDASVGSMIALLRYGSGMPFNRLGGLQGMVGVPLPASTQWDIVHEMAEHAAAAYGELLRQAAQGDVVYNDDTPTRILELMGRRARQRALAETAKEDPDQQASRRTGLYTSGIVSTREGRRIALFFSGRKHAGENLKDLLMRRAQDLTPPIQMCDALSRNLPQELETIVANCLAHGRRQFVDVIEQFPDECRYVLETLQVVYRNDAIARERNLSPQARLQFHQDGSGPPMDQLKAWLARQFDERLVEPNSSLGGAIRYLQRHWEKLTLFLRVPGAPLDNNTAERALKKAILHRRNSLFYRTENGTP